MSEANKTIARRFLEEIFTEGNLAAADELVHPDYQNRNPMAGQADQVLSHHVGDAVSHPVDPVEASRQLGRLWCESEQADHPVDVEEQDRLTLPWFHFRSLWEGGLGRVGRAQAGRPNSR